MAIGLQRGCDKARERWLADRRKSVGGSELATIVGATRWSTPLKLYLEKIGEAEEREDTEQTWIGRMLEVPIENMFCEKTGRRTLDPGTFHIQRNPEFDFLHSTDDRHIYPVEGKIGKGAAELKNVGKRMIQDWDNGVPLYVQCQLQVQLVCNSFQWGSVAVLLAGTEFQVHDFGRNESFIRYMLEQAAEFMDRVKRRIPPEPQAGDSDTLLSMFPRQVSEKVITLPGSLIEVADDLAGLKLVEKTTEGAKAEAENRIKAAMGDAERGILPDGRAFTWKEQVRKAHEVAESRFRKLTPVKARKELTAT